LPTYFDLAQKDGACVVIHRETGNIFDAPKVNCKPVATAEK